MLSSPLGVYKPLFILRPYLLFSVVLEIYLNLQHHFFLKIGV